MSVIVKNMRMPETCIQCPMQFGGWCYVSPPEISERVAPTVPEAWDQKKPKWCPLEEQTSGSDSITRQAAIDELTTEAEMLKRVLDDMDVVGNEREKFAWGLGLIESCIDDMKDLPSAQPEQRWIPCSERLPKDFQRVLVTVVNYAGNKVVRVAEYYGWKSAFQIKENHEQWEVGEKGLLAWMPLPAPFEPQESEE